MIQAKDVATVLKGYDLNNLTIGVLGGHSALDVCRGAKKFGLKTLVVAQKGRGKTYAKYYKTRERGDNEIGCIDEVLVLDQFSDIVQEKVQTQLREENTIFIHNRYFWVYCDFEKIEQDFLVPIYGTRTGVKLEERHVPNNQYHLLKKAGIRMPKILREGGEHIDEEGLHKRLDGYFNEGESPLIVKANEAARSYERAFFVISRTEDYFETGEKLVKEGKVTEDGLASAVIEEFVIGAQVNLNFFYSPLTEELELMGTDTRRQTDLDGFLRLNAEEQSNLLRSGYTPKMIETGHYAVTMKESLIEKAYAIGEQFVKTMAKEVPPGMIGPFALQGAVASSTGKEEFVIFDVSMRIPGSPGTASTPYSGYLYGNSISYGERIAMEIVAAKESGRLAEIIT